jgi:hypothetical protein
MHFVKIAVSLVVSSKGSDITAASITNDSCDEDQCLPPHC